MSSLNHKSKIANHKSPAPLALSRVKILPRAFYSRDPRIVARALLGKVLVRRAGRALLAGRIVEVEAYLGAGDAAAHSAAGRTARNFVIFGPPGHAYVYFIYGNHYCLNVSCLPEGKAGCVLIRALEPMAGLQQMARNRSLRPEGLWGERPARAGEAQAPQRLLRLLTTGPRQAVSGAGHHACAS